MKTFISRSVRDWFEGFPRPEPPKRIVSARLTAWSVFGLFLLALLAVLYFAHVIVVPIVAAAVTAIIFSPVAHWLERRRLPSGLSALAVIFGLVLALAAAAAAIVPTARDLGERLPQMAARIEFKLADLRATLRSLQEAKQQLDRATDVAEDGRRREVQVTRDSGIQLGTLGFQVGFFVVLTYFLLASRVGYRRRLILSQPSQAERLRTARILRDMGKRVSSYLFTVTMINVGLGVVTAACLAAIGMPFAVLLGFAITLLNFVLIIGPILVIAATTVLSLATFDDWSHILAAPGIVLVLHLIESQFVSPWLIGRRLEISPLAVFASIAVLGWMWGAVGAMVAVPILILLYTFGQHIPALSPLAALIGPAGPDEDEVEDENAKTKAGEAPGGARGEVVGEIAVTMSPPDASGQPAEQPTRRGPAPGLLSRLR